jgi:lactate dehydrogenase-like 2-hydroxyacid dehydrogenase
MAVARRLTEGYDYVRAGRWKTWQPMLLLGPDVHRATLGIVGFGRIGRAVAQRASGFGMTVIYHDVQRASQADESALNARYVEMDELLAQSDFISLHPNLTPETRHLLNREAFARMKRSAIVVNTSRGPVIDQPALYEALRDGVIAGAGLDVTDPEPIAADDPLLKLPNCLVVPHIASASRATRARMAEMAAANLLAGVRGERLPNAVNPEVFEGR